MGECITVIAGPVELFILGEISPMGIDPVYLNLRACEMDWRTQFSRFFLFYFLRVVVGLSRALLAERIAVLLVVVKI